MAHGIIDLLALTTSCLALYFTVRLKKTYFLDSRFFMAVANVGFIVVLLQNTISDLLSVPPYQDLNLGMISLMAASVGFASFLLEKNVGGSGFGELAGFLSNPPRPFLVYLGIVLGWTLVNILFQPYVVNRVSGPDGTIYYASYEGWYLSFSFVLLASFLIFPVLSLYRQSLHITDSKASKSMKIIGLSWASFGVIAFLQAATAGTYFPLAQSLAQLADGLLFVLISFALREPTILSRMIAAGENLTRALYSYPDTDAVVLYNIESDRRRLVEAFVKDGLASGDDVVCFVAKAEVPFYRALLQGIDAAEPSRRKGQTTIQTMEVAASLGSEGTGVPPGFSRSRRELLDLGEMDSSHCHQIIGKVRALDDLPGPRRRGRIWALNVEGAHSELVNEILKMNPSARVIDLAGHQDSFSELLEMKHQNLRGSRILLEYEPTSNYEEVVQKFAREFLANVEPIAVFTSMGSPIYRQFREQRNIRIFSFSAKTSTPSKVSEEQVLLPERDTSLLLDAVDKLLQAYHGRPLGMVFDVFTDLILFQGFEKAYGVLSSVVEMAESESATALVLVNYVALEDKALNGVRGLFRSQARYDSEGLKPIRIHITGRITTGEASPETNERRVSAWGISR